MGRNSESRGGLPFFVDLPSEFRGAAEDGNSRGGGGGGGGRGWLSVRVW